MHPQAHELHSPPTHLQSPAEHILLLQDSPISLKVMTELGLMLYTG